MALVTLKAPDGRLAMPVFTSAAALAAWHPEARPVAVYAARAALVRRGRRRRAAGAWIPDPT